MNKSDVITNLATALSKVQGKLNGAVKDSTNPFFKSKYANLESVWESIRELMAAEGLSVSQMPGMLATGQPTLVTMLMHKSGEFLSSEQPLFPVKQDPQGIAAAITYARRSALSAIIGQIEVEDDGETAMGRNNPPQEKEYREPLVAHKISEAQLKRLFAIQKKCGVTDEQLKAICEPLGIKSRSEIPNTKYNEIISKIEGMAVKP